ncbi:MAG: aldo/keto reductase [Gemmataceae bacterium]|nr:aldo/keto reductase [Gemmataceae bacterium]MCI0739954.1 aldo/keto reductase [Gemmataceae bacterium]
MFWRTSQKRVVVGPLRRRALGKTGHEATLFGLGGEGVLRTHGRMREAAAVITRALDQGVNYFDTAPAYDQSMDYYGAALGERRRDIFLACKTHDRSRDSSLRLLDDCLRRLRTDFLDLWQLHDLRTLGDLERVFAKGGALEALVQARADGRVRFLGLTGHHDPAILLEAMRRFSFDTVLVALNAADVHRLSFLRTVVPEAMRQNMGVIAMKVCSQGRLLGRGGLTMAEALGYVWSQAGVTLAIVGCETPEEVDANAQLAREFVPLPEAKLRELEERTRRQAETFAYYKKGS